MLDSDPGDDRASATVNLDIADGVRQLTDHLLALGHRHITHLAADVDSWTFRVRARAVSAALDDVPGTLLRTQPAALGVDAGLRAAHAALSGPGPRPTALLCDDDIIAHAAPARPSAASACGCPKTSPSPDSTTSRSRSPSNRS